MKAIEGFEKYQITEDGKIYSCLRGKFLKPWVDRYGYLIAKLRKDGKSVSKAIHRLVAETYKPTQNTLNLQVNHIDGDKQNNNYLNLEWVTHMENSLHADEHNLVTKKLKRKPVSVYTLDGVFIESYISTSEAARLTGIPQPKISQCCLGIYKEYHNLVFRYSTNPFTKYPVSLTKYHK